MRLHHLCITCTCPDHLETWIAQALIATTDPADTIPTSQAFDHYIAWWFDQGKPAGGLSQHKLTRRLRLQGIPMRRTGQGNLIVGYRLAS